MTPNKPYLIRALNEWILDNQMTPFLLVDANSEGVEVPQQHIRDGKIILNVTPNAVQEISFADEGVYFSARFNGRAFIVNIPINAVLAIYAKENGRGMMFAGDEMSAEDDASPERKGISREATSKKPVLTVVK